MEYYAHTAIGPNRRNLPEESGTWQTQKNHLRNVADLAKSFGEPLGLAVEAEWAGLLHDLGKYAERFQARLRNSNIHGINHWAAGATKAAEAGLNAVAFAIDGHHTGIPTADGDGLKQTIARMRDEQTRRDFCKCEESVQQLYDRFCSDQLQPPSPVRSRVDPLFAEAMRIRMLFSCLVDADFLDTEKHFSPGVRAERKALNLQAERASEILLKHLSAFPKDGEVNAMRSQLLQDCLRAAKHRSGLFTLTAPTGSGKTLSSMAFALKHIENHNAGLPKDDPQRFRRIIVVIPFTSVIEQTAQVYRDIFAPHLGAEYVLEHHSAVAPRNPPDSTNKDAEDDRSRRARFATENWDAPVVVTTSVRFFESLFSNRPSDCRKLHNLGRSVILFDEVQTLPHDRVPSLLSAVKILTRDYGVTAVFMTATQPAFGTASDAVISGWYPTPIANDEEALARALRRTRIRLPARDEVTSWERIADLMMAEKQALCVANTTAEARDLFKKLRSRYPSAAWHLSSRMCPAHRREALTAIRKSLAEGEPCRLVSTQLIEAGVDVDFPIAFRALGPLDSIIQTAGRCNREGKSPTRCPVLVFRPQELKTPPGAYRTATAKTDEFLNRHPDAEDRLHLPEFYAAYFRELYGLLGPQAQNDDKLFAACAAFDFPKTAELARLISQETQAVLVQWGDGERFAQKLAEEKHLSAIDCRRAQQFSVNLYRSEFLEAQAKGYIYQPAEGWGFWIWNSEYDKDLGLGHAVLEDFSV